MKKILLLIAILCISFILTAQNELFEKREFIYKDDTLRYRVLFPKNYNKKEKYPLVVFLHGAGERGFNNEKQLLHGSFLFTDPLNRKNFPCIVIFPQCPSDDYWAPIIKTDNERTFPEKSQPTHAMNMVERLIISYQQKEATDKKRLYILGISMGGMGTFDLICRQPRKFACAVPICGGVNLERLKKIRRMPIRIYHGSADPVVSVEFSRDAFIELKAAGSQKVEYIEYPGVGHESWNNAFAEPDFLKWIFEQRK